MDTAAKDYWESIAPVWTDAWPRPPLRPSESDVRELRQWAARAAAGRGVGLDALILGLTRPIAGMDWPRATQLVAVDGSAAMIRRVWPGCGAPEGAVALQADWTSLPLADACRDFVAADCMHGVLATRAECDRVHGEVRRVLRPGGWFCIRTYLRPEAPEPLGTMFGELRAGAVGNLHLFGWRLAAALQGASPDGVPLHRVWEAWNRHMPDPGEVTSLAEACGWMREEVRLIDRWRGARIARTAPSWSDLEAYARGRFEIVDRVRPAAPDAARFTLVAMRAC